MPKEFFQNLLFREELIAIGSESEEDRRHIWMMCARDPLFFFNAFLFTFDPRKKSSLPFITYEGYQDETIIEIVNAIAEQYSLNLKKSRDMGVSWMLLGVFLWLLIFHYDQSFMLLSRKQELVDQKGDPDSLFWKLDYMIEHLPPWMRPAPDRTELHLGNKPHNTVIDGESTNKDVGRGGRRTAIGWDEAAATPNAFEVTAATANNCDCRLRVYTPKGTGTEAYESERAGTRTLKLHWILHPEHRRGLYTTRDGKIDILDPDWSFPADYPFIIDTENKPRSVWYDLKCRELSNIPALIAAELDMDDQKSESTFFDAAFLDQLEATCIPPRVVGELDYDRDGCVPKQLLEREHGCLAVWGHVSIGGLGRPPADRTYTIGCDISQGTGASNSTAVVTDDKTGEKVAEYVNPNIKSHEFARYAAALGRFFAGPDGRPALLIWEDNGPGVNFGSTMKDDIKYENMWFRSDDTPGWAPTSEGKLDLLSQYRAAQMDGIYLERSVDCVREQREFVLFKDQTVGHRASKNQFDPSGAKASHGDRVVATALSYKGSKSKRPIAAPPPPPDSSMSTLAGRQAARRREHQGSNYWQG